MPVVESIDYETRRIHLSAETMNANLDTLDVYREVRSARRTNENDRKFEPMIVAGGNIQKTLTTFTPAYVILLDGCRLVPYDSSHELCLCRETFTDDNLSGTEVFDRSSLSPSVVVDINVNIQEVEIRVVETSSGLSSSDRAIIEAIKSQTDLLNFTGTRVNSSPSDGALVII